MQDVSNYEKIREDARNFYKKLGRIRCPVFNNEYVYFTSEGFNHLVYKNERDKNIFGALYPDGQHTITKASN